MSLTYRPRDLVAHASVIALLAVSPTFAQSPSATATSSGAQNDNVVVLDPFSVPADSTNGYQATNSVTATRIPTATFDTPLSIFVATGDFLEDTNSEARLDDAYKYIPGVSGDPRADNTGRGLFGASIGTARGFPISAVIEDGLPRQGNFDLRDVDRVEVLEGPVSVFFGSAQPGGTVSIVSRRPDFTTDSGSIDAKYSTFETSPWASKDQTTDGTEVDVTENVHIGDIAAFRIFAFDSNDNGWHDREYYHQRGATPYLTLKPFKRLEISTKFEYLLSLANPAGQAPGGNAQMWADYANPPAAVLAANGLTATQYRANIFSGGTNWGIYAMNTYGYNGQTYTSLNLYRTAGLGAFIFPQNSPFAQPAFSYQSATNFLNTNSNISTTFVTYEATDWLTLRYAFMYDNEKVDYIETSETIPNADGETANVGTSQGGQTKDLYRYHQINALAHGTLWGVKNDLVLGLDYDSHYNFSRNRNYNYSLLSYTTTYNGAVESGQNVFTYWNPSTTPNPPEMSQVQNGFQPPSSEYDNYGAEYANWDSEFTVLGHRIMPFAGIRHESTDSNLWNTSDQHSYQSSAGDSSVYGITVGLTPDLNAYVSHSQNWLPNVGYTEEGVGVDRDIHGNIVPGLNEGSTPLQNQTGEGTDVGLKFKLFDGTVSGSIGWFTVERSHIMVQNSAAQAADPRDQDGIYYPNASGTLEQVNAGFQPVTYYTTTGEERNEGFETQIFYQPIRNDQLIISLANIYDSRIVSNIALSDPVPATQAAILNGQVLLNRRLAESPEWQGGVFDKYTFTSGPLDRVWIGGGIHGQTTTMPRSDDSQDAEFFHKGYVIEDLSLGYDGKLFGRHINYTLAVTNLFDRLYSYGNFAYGDPREVSLSAKLNF